MSCHVILCIFSFADASAITLPLRYFARLPPPSPPNIQTKKGLEGEGRRRRQLDHRPGNLQGSPALHVPRCLPRGPTPQDHPTRLGTSHGRRGQRVPRLAHVPPAVRGGSSRHQAGGVPAHDGVRRGVHERSHSVGGVYGWRSG